MLNQTATPSPPRGLIRILGVGFGLAVIVGSTIGIGILRTPGLVAGQLPSRTAILAVWVAGGVYTLIGAACLVELGTMLPAAGGYYVYARRAFALVVGAAMIFAPATAAPSQLAAQTSFSGLVVALQSVVITYGGWQSGLYFAEEDRDPGKNLPRSMIGGVAAVIAVYVLVNVALLTVLPIADIARSTLPAADAAQVLLGRRGGEIITVLSIVSLPPML